jgi:hypothetical protein
MPGTNTSEAPVDAIPIKRKNRLRMCLYTSLSFLVASVGMFIVLGLTRHAHDLGYTGPKNTFEGPSVRLAGWLPGMCTHDLQVEFELVFIAADPKEGTITLDWRIIGQAHSPCTNATLFACRDINIFFDK